MSALLTGEDAAVEYLTDDTPRGLHGKLLGFLADRAGEGRWEVVANFVAHWSPGYGYCHELPRSAERDQMVHVEFVMILAKAH